MSMTNRFICMIKSDHVSFSLNKYKHFGTWALSHLTVDSDLSNLEEYYYYILM